MGLSGQFTIENYARKISIIQNVFVNIFRFFLRDFRLRSVNTVRSKCVYSSSKQYYNENIETF